jgi:hypothetical protein
MSQNAAMAFEPIKSKHYRVSELAEIWNISCDTTRRIFLMEPGVLVIKTSNPRKRRYRTLLIPEPVAERVYRRLCNQP